MLCKIKNKKNGKYFVKVLNGTYHLGEDNNHYKIPEWVYLKGTIFQTEKELKRALNKLTKISQPTNIRPYPIYPTCSMDDLEIEKIVD